jgi:hypothetical protein
MAEKVADYEKLLKDLASRVGEDDARLIKAALDKETAYDLDDASVDNTTVPSVEVPPSGEESGAESDASAGAGSTGALDRTDEDFTREDARQTGFMGKNSEITWLQRLKHENNHGDNDKMQKGMSGKRMAGDMSTPIQESDVGMKVSNTSYHLDDLAVTTFEAVDPYEYPTAEVAQQLFNSYITRVHPTYPIVGKVNLTTQFNKFISGQVTRPPPKWLAIINLIFAIGAKYAHLIQADWKGDERDHLIYFTRARKLALNEETLFQHPDLQSIQIVGLISLYFMCVSQINRAWNMIGIAIRWATSLGLNMRNDSTELKDGLKEIRYRVWWALYSLEHRLCCMTGRVNCILDDHCTTPLPVPLEETQFESELGLKMLNKENQQGPRAPGLNSHSPSQAGSNASSASRSRSQTKASASGSRSPSAIVKSTELSWARDVSPNQSLYFLHLIQLTRLTQKIFHQLYNPSAIEGTWSDIQHLIGELGEQLENWYRALPPILDFKRSQRDRDFYECRLSLGFFYNSTKVMIHRPCLCRLDRKIPHQSNKSLEFNRNAATTCIDAARDNLQLIPDEPNPVGLIKVGPWWSILHWLVQSSSVLMLELSFRAHHMPEEADSVLEAAKKSVRWLHALAEDNMSARRAWALCDGMLREAAAKIGRSVDDMPRHQPGPSPFHQPDGHIGDAHQIYTTMPPQPTYSAAMGRPDMAQYPVTSGFGDLDQLMHFDQYSPMVPNMNFPMHFQQPMDAEFEFMTNEYHEGQGPQNHGPRNPR